jgi:hypothetical protein
LFDKTTFCLTSGLSIKKLCFFYRLVNKAKLYLPFANKNEVFITKQGDKGSENLKKQALLVFLGPFGPLLLFQLCPLPLLIFQQS